MNSIANEYETDTKFCYHIYKDGYVYKAGIWLIQTWIRF